MFLYFILVISAYGHGLDYGLGRFAELLGPKGMILAVNSIVSLIAINNIMFSVTDSIGSWLVLASSMLTVMLIVCVIKITHISISRVPKHHV
jgi:hypothetical protein